MEADMSSVEMKREGIDLHTPVKSSIKGFGKIRVTFSVWGKPARGNRKDENKERCPFSPVAQSDELVQMSCAAAGGRIGKKSPGAFRKSTSLCLDPDTSGAGLSVKIKTPVRRGDFRFERRQGAQGTVLSSQKSLSQGPVKSRVDHDPVTGAEGGDDVPGGLPSWFYSGPEQKAVSLCEEFGEPAGVMKMGGLVISADESPDSEPVGAGEKYAFSESGQCQERRS
jgi:hypothetical protein